MSGFPGFVDLDVPPKPSWRPDEWELAVIVCKTCHTARAEWFRDGVLGQIEKDWHCDHPAEFRRIDSHILKIKNVHVGQNSGDSREGSDA